ncbi:MAG: P-II family nitrogen regulator [Thermoanaerobaculia bacterium]
MKLLKAFVRMSRADEIVRALERGHAAGITISRVHGVGYGYDAFSFTLSPSEVHKTPEVAKIEVVCDDDASDRLVRCIVEAGRTGSQGDGIVFVENVERAVKIRTGAEGLEAIKTEKESVS